MKFPFTIFTLVFTMALSSTSFAEWTETGDSVDGATFYVDYERIREHEGYVYFWTLIDLSTRMEQGVTSLIAYWQGDCKLFRLKDLSETWYNGRMGRGDTITTLTKENKPWAYPPPKSVNEIILTNVCRFTR
jgi:hypothetical protein